MFFETDIFIIYNYSFYFQHQNFKYLKHFCDVILVALFHLHQPMVFLSHSSYGMPGLCSSYECFILRAARLSSKLLEQGYVMERLKSSLKKFYGRYGDLIKNYEVSLSQMLHDILGYDHI